MSYGSSGYNNPPPWSRSSSSAHVSNTSSYQNIGNVTYPIKRPHSPDDYVNSFQPSSSTSKTKSLSGYVTKLYESWGIIDNEVQFSFSSCVKGIPKLKDLVSVDAIHSPETTYKWRATKVVLISNGRDYSNLKPIPNSRLENEYRRIRGLDKNRERSRERRYDEIERKRLKRDDKDDKIREYDKDNYKEREKIRDYDRSPLRRSKSPIKRKLIRYAVKVPLDLLTLSEGDIITLKKRYPSLYIPSDFFTSTFCWSDTFPIRNPYVLNKPCNFHIMHKDSDSYIVNDAILDPPDVDYSFSAKVMMMSIPRLNEVYKKTMCLAEDLSKDDDKSFIHLSRMIQFLVGSRGKNELLAIGGPWSPSLDGDCPEKDPSVLIKTAIRTCKALTGIDLSLCSQWYRFMEVYYHRSESVHKGKTIPARVETVVFFLPEVWNCVPSSLEWNNVILNYKKIMEEKLQPKKIDESANHSGSCDQAEESDKEEDLVVIDKCEEKVEPTYYSELDPNTMKVNDLRQELEARGLSVKGLKQHLVQRLELALRKERDLDLEEADTAIKGVEKEPNDNDVKMNDNGNADPEMKVIDDSKEDNASLNGESKESKKEVVLSEVLEIVDPAVLEKRYTLPDTPHIVVHPSKTAKGGKYDCYVMSLATLLDYRANENKEHSFELFLFAELFHEMLQRDFGFYIYKALCEVPEKFKDEKDDKEIKKIDKDVHKLEEKDEKEDKCEKHIKEKSLKNELGDSKTTDGRSDHDSRSEEIKKKEKLKLMTKDPHLLLSFVFFDRTQCGYIFDRDLENLIFSLGLCVSRHQVKKLISKVAIRDTVYYRKITDKPDFGEDFQTTIKDAGSVALGNRKYFPIFKKEVETSQLEKDGDGSTEISISKISGMVYVDGIVVDVEKVTSNLKKSETERLQLESQLLKCKEELDALQESFKRLSEKEKRVSEDFKICRDKLMTASREKISNLNKSRSYYKLLISIKDQISSIEEKQEKNTTKIFKSTEKVDEKVLTPNIKKDENLADEKSDVSYQEKKICNPVTKNEDENDNENETISTSTQPEQAEQNMT